jgi:transposase
MWFWDELLAVSTPVAGTGGMAEDPRGSSGPASRSQQDRLFSGGGGQLFGEGRVGGAKTGPNPTDRRKNGTKHHIIVEAQGIPLAVRITEANRHDVTQLITLVEAIPPIRGKRGRPRRRPEIVQGDCGYDSEPHRCQLRACSIIPLIRKRNTEHGSGLGSYRWVVERTLSWLHQFRRLRVRYERRDDIHEAFLVLGCIMICWSALVSWNPLC